MREGWLERSLRSASAEVATWPEWKKKAMRVLEERSSHSGAEAFRPGTDEYKQRLRDQAAVALLPGLVEGYGEHATKNGWEYGWQEGVAQDAVILADALVAALYPEEGSDED